MSTPFSLYMMLLGCLPDGRFTEQHDVFFGIAQHPSELIPQIIESWPEAKGRIHIDAVRPVRRVDGYHVKVVPKGQVQTPADVKLFFLNLGGYTPGVFDELHYKMLVAAPEKGEAIQKAKRTAFYKHTGYKEAPSHIDDKYGVDVDNVYEIGDILAKGFKEQFALQLTPALHDKSTDEIILGYITFDKLQELDV